MLNRGTMVWFQWSETREWNQRLRENSACHSIYPLKVQRKMALRKERILGISYG